MHVCEVYYELVCYWQKQLLVLDSHRTCWQGFGLEMNLQHQVDQHQPWSLVVGFDLVGLRQSFVANRDWIELN